MADLDFHDRVDNATLADRAKHARRFAKQARVARRKILNSKMAFQSLAADRAEKWEAIEKAARKLERMAEQAWAELEREREVRRKRRSERTALLGVSHDV